METKHITSDELRKILREACKKSGSQRKWALDNKFSASYIGDVLKGNREPSDTIGKIFGYIRVKGWVKKAAKKAIEKASPRFEDEQNVKD